MGIGKRKSPSAESIAFATIGECSSSGGGNSAVTTPGDRAPIEDSPALRRLNRQRERERQAENRRRRREIRNMSFRNVYKALRMRLSRKIIFYSSDLCLD